MRVNIYQTKFLVGRVIALQKEEEEGELFPHRGQVWEREQQKGPRGSEVRKGSRLLCPISLHREGRKGAPTFLGETSST